MVNARAQRERRNFAQFKALIAAPGNLLTGITLPAGAKLYASCASATASVQPFISINNKVVNAVASLANVTQPMGYAEELRSVIKAPGAPGVISLYVDNGLGKLVKIAQG